MKYRIIKHGNKKPYYIAQYVDEASREWRTLSDAGVWGLVAKRFSSRRDAIKVLRNITQRQMEENQVRVIEEDVL